MSGRETWIGGNLAGGTTLMGQRRTHPLWSGLTGKLLLGFGGVMMVLIVVAGLLAAFLTSSSRQLQKGHRENYDSVSYCEAMRSALDEAQAIAQLNRPFPEMTRETLEKARQEFEANGTAQLGNTTLLHEAELSRKTVDLGRDVFQKTRRLVEGNSIGDVPTYYRAEIFPEYQQCRDALAQVSQMNLQNLVRVNGDVERALLATRTTVIMLLVIGLMLSLLFIVLTARGMIGPLMNLTTSVRQIEAGNLDLIVEGHSHDEIGELAQAFNEMAAKLREFRRMDLERLSRTQQTTQTAIDSLPDAVAVMNIRGEIEISNRAAQVHFKLVPGETIQSIRPDWAKAFFDPVAASAQGIVPDGYRTAIQLFDESGERFLLPRAEPMFDSEKRLIGVTLVLVEITHLRKADEFKSGLLSAVSHELKTPLTSVRMAMRMLQDPRIGELNQRQQTLMAAAQKDAERLVRTVDDILTIGRVEAGRTRLDLAYVTAQEIVKRSLAPVESAAAERNIRIVQETGDGEPRVLADLNLAACALTNLLSNAVRFSPPGSTVNVRVSSDSQCAYFAVTDQGPGIPEEFRSRIFEKYFRIPMANGPAGAGLGLSIASEIIQLHNGSIDLAATSGQGSTFVIRLPLKNNPR